MFFPPMSFPYTLRKCALLLVFVSGPWCAHLHAMCTLNPSSPSVTICEPVNGATVPTPVHIVAGTTDTRPVTLLQIYVDGLKKYEVKANSLDTSLAMPLGARRVTVQAKDSAGTVFKGTVNITVTNSGPPTGLTNLNHIVFMLQENRSFDNYFGRMGQYRRDRGFNDQFDELPLNVAPLDRAGHPVSPYHFQTVCHENLSPAWSESHYDYHNGLMDRFMLTTGSVSSTYDPDGTRAMGYYDWTDLPYYYELAFQYATSDRFFSSVMSNTAANRYYMFGATSFGHVRYEQAPSGGWTYPTIFDRLTTAGITWRYYYIDTGQRDITMWSTYPRDRAKVFPISQYYIDVQNEATFPQVVFIERGSTSNLDEHPSANIQTGAANTKKLIEAVMQSPGWGSSVFILSFDEGGGLYDHVPPATVPKPDAIAPILNPTDLPGDFNQTGFRIPLIVISPWTKPHFVSHTVRDLTSILSLIEARFGLATLTARDAAADNMTEFFDFSAPHNLTIPVLPDQPTNGTCLFSLERAPGH